MGTFLSPATVEDRTFFQRELESFVPGRVFDAHAHLWRKEAITWPVKDLPANAGYAEYQALMEDLHPGRRTAALFLPGFSAEKKEMLPRANDWVSRQVAAAPD